MRIFLTLLLSFLSVSAQAQYYWSENFEAPNDLYRNHFIIDTVNYHHNAWQVGRPHKAVFDSASAFSAPNVIVTDTLNPCSPNDTSVFTIEHYLTYATINSLNFKYKLDIDSGSIAKVEVSGDRGANWINPITEDTTYMFYWGFTKPRLDTSVNTWKDFQLNISTWANAYTGSGYTFPHYRTSDTILFRFTYISDSDTTHHDGWMMDNFYAENPALVGIGNQNSSNDIVSIYPLPCKGNLCYQVYELPSANTGIAIYDMKGQEVYNKSNIPLSGMLNLQLPDGVYMLKASSENGKTYKKLVILR